MRADYIILLSNKLWKNVSHLEFRFSDLESQDFQGFLILFQFYSITSRYVT